ncbi:MAG TPA: type II toxin-antitoxin system RelE/ParE family toxin [Clostridiales bacterium]|nr:type II toxin-antitoxin system RelE/ParE family toxin [Clostridiales bacterium]HQP69797.1 type II toxin-antitoxin system RelE/ParE family toxin [Clostridiales bacterium]
MLNKFQIAETDQFTSKIYDVKYRKIYKKIRDFVYPQLRTNPFFGANIKKLKGTFAGVYRYRIGNYRLFYIIENEKVLVIILDINDRKDAYN